MKDVKNIIENTVKLIWKKKYTFQFYKVTAFGMKGECTVPPGLDTSSNLPQSRESKYIRQ